MAADHRGVNAAENLLGRELPGGWRVVERVTRQIDDTGGHFSVNYRVENGDGRQGFCKVLNYHWIMTSRGQDPVTAMAEATTMYEFERDLARTCARLSRVVTALDDGTIFLEGFDAPTVSYIIFEAAERDIRGLLDTSDFLDTAVRLRSLHNLATGVAQLHSRDIAHQDIKPSNLLVFPPGLDGSRLSKLGDLGRATSRERPMRHDDLDVAGDRNYGPPEGLYHALPAEYSLRRYGSDLYQLGSMVCFIFTGTTINAQVSSELDPQFHWTNWHGSFDEVLPYLQAAFSRALETIGESVPEPIRGDIVALIRELCEPDPYERGDHHSRGQWRNPLALDRVITRLDLLSRTAEVRLRRAQ